MADIILRLQEPRTRPDPRGVALWELGFRPFYALAALFAALSVPLWALQFTGVLKGAWLRGAAWHAHEMVFGYALAVVIGFLFTAGRNWSGHPTPTGRPLMALAALWVLGRLLVLSPWGLAAALVNIATPCLAALGLWRALRAGGNRRNHVFVAALLAMGAGAGIFHAAQAGGHPSWQAWGLPLAIDTLLFMIAVMSGRVIPNFSNNGVPGMKARRDDRLEKAALTCILVLGAGDIAGLHDPWMLGLLSVAGLIHTARWMLWQPWRCLRNPLVWILHAAYLWLPVHLGLRAMAELEWVAPSLATHALTVGLIGGMTMGMITRTALGHTGRPLKAGPWEVCAYIAVLAAAAVRVGVPLFAPEYLLSAVAVSASLWSLAFACYLWRYGPFLLHPRIDGLAG